MHLDKDKEIEKCYQCSHLNKAQVCTLTNEQIPDLFRIPFWCPLPNNLDNDLLTRAIELKRLQGVLRATLDRRCRGDEVLDSALTSVELETVLLISSIKKKEK